VNYNSQLLTWIVIQEGKRLTDTSDGWSHGRKRKEEADPGGAGSSPDQGTSGRWQEEHGGERGVAVGAYMLMFTAGAKVGEKSASKRYFNGG